MVKCWLCTLGLNELSLSRYLILKKLKWLEDHEITLILQQYYKFYDEIMVFLISRDPGTP